MFFYRFLKEWRKNPRWSFSCCLELVLPVFGLHGEIGAIAETNILTNQLQTGNIEKPTILSSVNDSGDVVVSHGNDENKKITQGGKFQYAKYTNIKCHQGTQTELFTLSAAAIVVHEPKEEMQGTSL